MRNEIIQIGSEYATIRCYDNGGKTADRYMVVYMDIYEGWKLHRRLYGSRSMSDSPFHPQGVAIYGEAMLGKHLGKRIKFAELPPDCQKLVLLDLRSDTMGRILVRINIFNGSETINPLVLEFDTIEQAEAAQKAAFDAAAELVLW